MKGSGIRLLHLRYLPSIDALLLPLSTVTSHAPLACPHVAFGHLQYGKAGRAWYISSHVKWGKISERECDVLRVVQSSTHSMCSPRYLDTCGMLPGTFSLLAVLSLRAPTIISSLSTTLSTLTSLT